MASDDDATLAGDRGDLRDLVAECLERAETEGAAAVEAVCAAHPHHAARIRAALQQLQGSGLFAAADADAGGLPQQVGEYRLLQRLGGGGMGVVFLAEQARLGREVALKLMRTDLLWMDGAKDRLLREVEAVARLSHPGIVSVYDVGEHGGRPFFSMEHVRGMTLADVIGEFRGRDPGSLRGSDLRAALERRSGIDAGAAGGDDLFAGSWSQVALRIVQRVAWALAHAHGRGIVHRDVKPSNVMLTAHGRVVLLDFGLAQLPGSPKITRTGSALGSLAYMSPEQLSRLPVDAGTDVYSLGITLYELLTLRSAFADGNPTDIEWRILHGMVPAPRKVVRSIPADAETVCCKAMERQAAARYGTMAEFAEDLGNVLELRPVQARRPGLVRRGVRLSQRHAAATTAVIGAVLVAAGAPLLWWWHEERTQERLVQLTLEQAQQRLDEMHARIRDERLSTFAGGSALREEMIRDALEHFDRARTLQPDNQALCRRGMRLLREYGSLFEKLNSREDAALAYQRCIGLAGNLHQPTAEDDLVVALAWTGRIASLQSLEQYDDARRAADEAFAFHDLSIERHGDDRQRDIARASLHLLLSKMAEVEHDDASRDRHIAQAIALAEPGAEAGDPEALSQLAYFLSECANYAQADNDLETAKAYLQRALDMHRQALAARPGDERFAGRLAAAVMPFSTILSNTGERDRAERLLEDACQRLESIVARYPEHYSYHSTLGGILNNLAQVRMGQSRFPEAIDLLERAIALQQGYVDRNPANRYARTFLANHKINLAFARVLSGQHRDLDAAIAEFPTLKGESLGHAFAAELSARRIPACRADATLDDDERDELLARYEEQALAHARAAVDAGLTDLGMLYRPALAELGDQATLAELRQRVERRAKGEDGN